MTEAGPAQRRPPSRSPRHLRPWQRPLGAAVVVLTIAGVASFAPIATASASASPVSHFEGAKTGSRQPPSTGHDQGPVTVSVGGDPQSTVVDPTTHTLYVLNETPGAVYVLNSATCNVTQAPSCGEHRTYEWPEAQVGTGADAMALDDLTHTLYVVNSEDNSVSVIDVATCNAEDTSGCDRMPPTVFVGNVPVDLAVNDLTDTVYVANWGNGGGTTLSVIDGTTCNAENSSGCRKAPAALTIGKGPAGVTVDPTTDTVYAATIGRTQSEAVSIVNGATCNALTTAGCGQKPHSVPTGAGSTDLNVAFQVDRATSTLYVANFTDNTLSMIDEATCNATVASGCGKRPPLVGVGSGPSGIALAAATHTIYVSNANDNTVSAFDAATCNALANSGCGVGTARSLVTGMQPQHVTYDPATSTLYVPNGNSNALSLLDAATCNAIVGSGCSAPLLGSKSFAGRAGVGWGNYEPVEIFNGGDPSGMVNAISWTSWGKAVATGYGKGYIFKPGGGYYASPVQVELRATFLGHCSTAGPLAYEHLEAREPSRPGGQLGNWLAWSGGKTLCRPGF